MPPASKKMTVLRAICGVLESSGKDKLSLAALRKELDSQHPEINTGARLLTTLKKAVSEGKLRKLGQSFALVAVTQLPAGADAQSKLKAPRKSEKNGVPHKGTVQGKGTAGKRNGAGKGKGKLGSHASSELGDVAPAPNSEALKGNTDDQALAIGESLVVDGTTGNEYIISREGKNEWFCTCPARKFAKKDEGGEKPHCKHILAIMDEYTATG